MTKRSKDYCVLFSPAVMLCPCAHGSLVQFFLTPAKNQTTTYGWQNTLDHLYASHIWATPPTIPCKKELKVWNGTAANQHVKTLTQQIIGSPVDPSLMCQSSEARLRHKIPTLFQIFHSCQNLQLEEGSYRHKSCLELYANNHGLAALAHAADIPADRASACLTISDIWQSMHKIEVADPIWQPMVTNSYIFPTDTYDALAYLEVQNLMIIAQTTSQVSFDIDSLTRGIKCLTDIEALEANAGIAPNVSAASKCFLHIIHIILFGKGGPPYGQTPPIGGILFCDIVKAGAMVLSQRWKGDMPWSAVSAAVFDIHPTTSTELTMATVALLDMEI
ncbi:hypothetical protein L208DRAFT_1382650 [Tricholoma matsutake]|nr:hypothetical protein L208DRAFT_1382650 [Tricholoma matsutake 945]